jgi:hypothetical protein
MGIGAHMSMTRVAIPALLAALLSSAPGCLRSSGPSEVAQGRYFAAGNPEYDEFFLAVYRLQLEMAAAPGELAEARRALGIAVVSTTDASNAQLAEKLKATLDRLADHGLRTRLELRSPSPPDPEHAMALLTTAAIPTGSDRQTVESIESSLTRVLRFGAAMRRASSKLAQLLGAVPRLQTGVDAAFHEQGHGKRKQVASNLDDAARVNLLMLARADELGKPTEALASELQRVLAPYFKPFPSPPVVEAPAPAPEAPPPRPRQGARSRATPAEPNAKAEPAKSADFEP